MGMTGISKSSVAIAAGARVQKPLAVALGELLHGDLPIDHGQDNAPAAPAPGPIHRDQIPVEDTFSFQAVARDPPPEGRVFMADDPFERINRVLKIVGRRRGKTGWHVNGGQRHVAVDQRDAERMKIK